MTQERSFVVHGIGFLISSDSVPFLDFLGRYFRGFEFSGTTSSFEADFRFRRGFVLPFLPARSGAEGDVFGEDVSYSPSDGILSFGHRELRVTCSLAGDPWRVSADFQKRLMRHVANGILLRGRGIADHYYRIAARLVVQNLLFMRLRERGIGILSASAVALSGRRALVFAGLSGSGKSTLAARICATDPSARILAHNYVLFDGSDILPFPEGERPDSLLAHSCVAAFVIGHGGRFSCDPLISEGAAAALEAINDCTAEMPEHSPFAALAIADPRHASAFDRGAVARFAHRVPVSRLIVDAGSEAVSYLIARHA